MSDLSLKVFVTSRSSEDELVGITPGEFELPVHTIDLLKIVEANGRFELLPPDGKLSAAWIVGCRRHPTLWTMEFQNEYD